MKKNKANSSVNDFLECNFCKKLIDSFDYAQIKQNINRIPYWEFGLFLVNKFIGKYEDKYAFCKDCFTNILLKTIIRPQQLTETNIPFTQMARAFLVYLYESQNNLFLKLSDLRKIVIQANFEDGLKIFVNNNSYYNIIKAIYPLLKNRPYYEAPQSFEDFFDYDY